MTEEDTGDDTEEESSVDGAEYIETDEFTLGIESDLLDLLVTESDLEGSPVINAEPDPRSGVVTVHLPFRFNWDLHDEDDELAFSENFVHTQMTPDRARTLIDQLETAVEEVEEERN